MLAFADRTGLGSPRPPRRYLWTDAFAVCNFLVLGKPDLAIQLVNQVHAVLGHQRHGGGWLPGAGDDHPTRGGLRIGKPMDERGPAERIDERLEWERDGQYFHYLTRWMHALDQVTRHTGDPRYREWARELAQTARRAFIYQHANNPRMYWKMSLDLSRPLVASMGQHDPIDGYITCLQLGLPDDAEAFAQMIDHRTLATTDPLGIGGLLADAYRLEQLGKDAELKDALLKAAHRGLGYYLEMPDLREPADQRVAFRELGLAIGLSAPVPGLKPYAVLTGITEFWLEQANRDNDLWRQHNDINDTMMATAIAPAGFLELRH